MEKRIISPSNSFVTGLTKYIIFRCEVVTNWKPHQMGKMIGAERGFESKTFALRLHDADQMPTVGQ